MTEVTKICRTCALPKSIEDYKVYYFSDSSLKNVSLDCDGCRRAMVRARSKRYYNIRHEFYKERGRYKTSNDLIKLRKQIISHYSNGSMACKCGENRSAVLHLDHINDDGKSHRARIGMGMKMYRWIVDNNYPAIFQVLCANCNIIKQKIRTLSNLSSNTEAMKIRNRNLKNKRMVFEHYSPMLECAECGHDDYNALQLDHINNDGSKHRRTLNNYSTSKLHRWVVENDYPAIFQVLCANCNFLKGQEYVKSLTLDYGI